MTLQILFRYRPGVPPTSQLGFSCGWTTVVLNVYREFQNPQLSSVLYKFPHIHRLRFTETYTLLVESSKETLIRRRSARKRGRNMEVMEILHMNKGVGETSYAMNSTHQVFVLPSSRTFRVYESSRSAYPARSTLRRYPYG